MAQSLIICCRGNDNQPLFLTYHCSNPSTQFGKMYHEIALNLGVCTDISNVSSGGLAPFNVQPRWTGTGLLKFTDWLTGIWWTPVLRQLFKLHATSGTRFQLPLASYLRADSHNRVKNAFYSGPCPQRSRFHTLHALAPSSPPARSCLFLHKKYPQTCPVFLQILIPSFSIDNTFCKAECKKNVWWHPYIKVQQFPKLRYHAQMRKILSFNGCWKSIPNDKINMVNSAAGYNINRYRC